MYKKFLIFVAMLAWLVGCIPVTPELTTVVTSSPTSSNEGNPGPYPVSTPLFPSSDPTTVVYPEPGTVESTTAGPLPLTSGTETGNVYPPSQETKTVLPSGESTVYPGPVSPGQVITPQPTQTGDVYPGPLPGDNTPEPTQPGDTYPGPLPGDVTPTVFPTSLALPTQQPGSTQASGTPDASPTAFLPEYRPTPVPGQFITIKIWHSWSGSQVQALEQVIQVFQSLEPTVSFDLLYVPYDELAGKYEAAAYRGEGPSLLLGDSDWISQFSRDNLVKDLAPYISEEFIETLSQPAYAAVQFNGQVLALPLGMRGVVLYRNAQLVASAPANFAELLELASGATRGGNVGLYLDWGCYFSCAHMQGLGGRWLDDQGQLQFNSGDYQAVLSWLAMLQQVKESGALVEFNQDQAVSLFKLGKIGMTIDGSYRAWEYAKAVGSENLAIDSWPASDGEKMAGYVQADAIFLNSNVVLRSPTEEQAALRFMGLLLTPEVQLRLAEVGFIPTVMKTEPRDELKGMLMQALNSGIAFPPAWQGEVRQAYWASIDAAAQSFLERSTPARQALETAAKEIEDRLKQINP